MATVELRDVKKNYGPIEVIEQITLTVEDGEFLVLVGPSGCGKSTLLRMIAGLEDITGGEIAIGGDVVNDKEPRERDIAMVFQSYALYPHMNVRDNMSFNLQLRQAPATEIAEKVGEAAGTLGLDELLGRRPRQLSGGQRQRVAMGRAIVRHPQVFLFDEPLSNLDAKLRVQVRTEIRELHQRLGATSIYVTHDQVEAMTMADRIVVLNEGHIEQIGSPLELYDTPANRFVAEFIGSPSINILSGEVVRKDGRPSLSLGGATTAPLPEGLPLDTGDRVDVGLRPEHIALVGDGLTANVRLVETLGPETFVYLDGDGFSVCCRTAERIAARIGDRVGLKPLVEHMHVFDAESGKRVNL